ncbi:hypothetical protein AVEN_98478-1, partial [Araneus ventricosus]
MQNRFCNSWDGRSEKSLRIPPKNSVVDALGVAHFFQIDTQ